MRNHIRSRVLLPVAATLLATPLAAQIVQHCVLVKQCRTVTTEFFGIVVNEEQSCSSAIICHYH